MSKTFDELLESVNPGDTITGFLKANLKTILHQELQKARHDWLREEIVKLEEEILDAELHYDMRGFEQTQYYCSALRGVLDRYQSELDQPTELFNTIKKKWDKQAEDSINGYN